MEKITHRHSIFIVLFIITISASSIVFIEPAPYDLLLLCIIFIALMSGHMLYKKIHFWPVLLIMLFLMTNVVSLYFMKELNMAVHG